MKEGKIEKIYEFKAAEDRIAVGYGLSINPKHKLLATASWMTKYTFMM